MTHDTSPTDIRQVWQDVLSELRQQVSSHNHETWLQKLTPRTLHDNVVELDAPDDFHVDWITEHYQDQLEGAFARVLETSINVEVGLPPTQVQLPFWADDERSAPNEFLRSALFGVVRRGRRPRYDNELIDSWRDVELRYTGEGLDQADLDVWLQAVQLLRDNELGKRVRFTMNGFLRKLGRATGGRSKEWLKRSFRRMTACSVELRAGGKTFGGSLISQYGWDEYTGEFFLVLDRDIARLFADDLYTRLHWETRLQLETDYSRWLHGYICSHRARADQPHRIRLAMLEKLSRSSFSRFRDFRRKVRESLDELQHHAIVAEWSINEDDVLTVTRCYSSPPPKVSCSN